MTRQQPSGQTKKQIEEVILHVVKQQKPETVNQLIKIIQEKTALSAEEIMRLLTELEKSKKVIFLKKATNPPCSLKDYILSEHLVWFWTVIMVAIFTTVSVFAIPENAYPIAYLRSVLGILFILFLPGFALLKLLFPSKIPIQTSNGHLNNIERLVLTVGLSLVLVPIVGLILNYTHWGLRLVPITLSLLGLTVVFALAGVMREILG